MNNIMIFTNQLFGRTYHPLANAVTMTRSFAVVRVIVASVISFF